MHFKILLFLYNLLSHAKKPLANAGEGFMVVLFSLTYPLNAEASIGRSEA